MTVAALAHELAAVIGEECTAALNSVGSVILIDFGTLSPYPLDAPPGKQLLRGKYTFAIFSPWRLTEGPTIYCDWTFPGGHEGKIRTLLKNLVGRRLEAASVSGAPWDLTLRLSGAMELAVFVDTPDNDGYAWRLTSADGLAVEVNPHEKPVGWKTTAEPTGS